MKHLSKLHVYNCIYQMYRRFFRNGLMMASFVFVSTIINAQANLINGNWKGQLVLHEDSTVFDLEFTCINNQLIKMNDETKTQTWFKKAKLLQQQDGESIIFWWTYQCQFGVQSKVYKLTYISEDSAIITWYRNTYDYVIRDAKENKWELAGTGLLLKIPAFNAIVARR